MKVQITTCEGSILSRKSYLHGKWLAERARSTILQQQLPSFRETLDQVRFSWRRLCWKVTKYGVHILWLTVPGYELFERPSYARTGRQRVAAACGQCLHWLQQTARCRRGCWHRAWSSWRVKVSEWHCQHLSWLMSYVLTTGYFTNIQRCTDCFLLWSPM